MKYLKKLSQMSQVTTLRIITHGYSECLPPEGRQNLTCIELGFIVTSTQGATNPRRLRLERFDSRYNAMLANPFNGVQSPVSLLVDSFEAASLRDLPVSLRDLSFLQKPEINADTADVLPTAVVRLSILCSLFVADFLTDGLVHLLGAYTFLHQHTFGLCLPESPLVDKLDSWCAVNDTVTSPLHNVLSLAPAMPALRHFAIHELSQLRAHRAQVKQDEYSCFSWSEMCDLSLSK